MEAIKVCKLHATSYTFDARRALFAKTHKFEHRLDNGIRLCGNKAHYTLAYPYDKRKVGEKYESKQK